jgi:catechol 2,3-dioxygenase-like lactoylglutathione lyase family enzyme
MKPRISLITLAVDDLDAAVRFYRDGLGLPTEGVIGRDIPNGAVAFFELQGGLRLALWPRASLAADAGLPAGTHDFAPQVSLAHNVNSAQEVDTVLAQARAAGAQVVKPGHATAWGGYIAYFRDPDGHLWEVAFNPQWVQAD